MSDTRRRIEQLEAKVRSDADHYLPPSDAGSDAAALRMRFDLPVKVVPLPSPAVEPGLYIGQGEPLADAIASLDTLDIDSEDDDTLEERDDWLVLWEGES